MCALFYSCNIKFASHILTLQIHDILRQLNQAKTANSIEEVGSELLKHIEEENKKKRKDLDTQLRETRRERDMAVEARDRAVEDRSTALRERDVAIFERDTAVSKVSINFFNC